jgi:hypothetical protein
VKRWLERDPIAAAILKARISAGLTQQQLAERLHTDQGDIARLECSRTCSEPQSSAGGIAIIGRPCPKSLQRI